MTKLHSVRATPRPSRPHPNGHVVGRIWPTEGRLRAFAATMEEMGAATSFPRDGVIYSENSPANYLYVVIGGTVRTYKSLSNGRRQIRSFYMPGDMFGLETGEEHAFSAEAITDVELLVIKRSAVVALASRDHSIAHHLWRLTSRELERVRGHVLLLVQSAQERVAGFLLEMANRVPAGNEVELPMSRQDIADYLGLTIETVSRTLTHLEKTAAIARPTSRRVVLRSRSALSQLNAESGRRLKGNSSSKDFDSSSEALSRQEVLMPRSSWTQHELEA
jgi:CRP/FNR family transcriptional regulator, nitrogen fixation regulation protein